jgi:hypothetical protein
MPSQTKKRDAYSRPTPKPQNNFQDTQIPFSTALEHLDEYGITLNPGFKSIDSIGQVIKKSVEIGLSKNKSLNVAASCINSITLTKQKFKNTPTG